MTVKYSKPFTIIGAITGEPVTILVEYVKTDSFKGISIESLEGTYETSKEFEKAYKQAFANIDVENIDVEDPIYNFLPMTLIDAKQLNTILANVIEIAETESDIEVAELLNRFTDVEEEEE